MTDFVSKDSFAIENPTSFVIDSALQKNYKKFHKANNRQIDSAISYGRPYLYSWHQRDTNFIEFTTIVDDSEHGIRIVYFIFDKNGNMISYAQIANIGWEERMIYETRSEFKSNDTLIKVSAASTWFDKNGQKMTKPKGDSTFSELTFTKQGQIIEKKLFQKDELASGQ